VQNARGLYETFGPSNCSKLPPSFRHIRLELAREKGHPQGSALIGYTFVAPLDRNSQIDAGLWHQHREFSRVVRFRPDEADDVGHLIRKQGGAFAFPYDIHGNQEEEAGYHFSSDRFMLGDYVSVREDDGEKLRIVATAEQLARNCG
jgi:hypothetical protein